MPNPTHIQHIKTKLETNSELHNLRADFDKTTHNIKTFVAAQFGFSRTLQDLIEHTWEITNKNHKLTLRLSLFPRNAGYEELRHFLECSSNTYANYYNMEQYFAINLQSISVSVCLTAWLTESDKEALEAAGFVVEVHTAVDKTPQQLSYKSVVCSIQ